MCPEHEIEAVVSILWDPSGSIALPRKIILSEATLQSQH